MKIWHISDTHSLHGQLDVPEGIDIVVHSGDATNWKDPYRNESELRAFIDWFAALPVRNKIFVPGNHDIPLYRVWSRLVAPYRLYQKYISPTLDTFVTLEGCAFACLNSTHPYMRIKEGVINARQVEQCVEFFEQSAL